jgi:tetratricopeptide (TPR) repeat protein
LADKGRDAGDFQRAEKLTRRALALQDQAVQDAKQKSGADSIQLAAARFSRANTRDSLAWSLFWQAGAQSSDKQRAAVLLEKAKTEQEAALKEAREASEESLSPELLYHLAIILSAQNVISPTAERREKALELLSEALELQPDFQPVQRAIELLT